MINDVLNARDRALEAVKKLKENQRYWVDLEHKKPDPLEIILTPTQQWAYVSDPQFQKKVNNMNENEIQEWNKQSLEWERSINE
jgi:hypothetical protein